MDRDPERAAGGCRAPRVSVVVPVYDAWPYLERCARAIVLQTLPADRYEAIFVDDGSTDEGARYLDDLAASHPQVRVVHQANSGWPGRPRNVGLDAARGEYVFFCDADDWLAEDALADLCDFADANRSEIVLPKMAGLGRAVPHHVFQRTVPRTSLADGPLMESLTAHKLYRRSFLRRHGIRFPEGRRRLEDHYFVVMAYLLAEVVSIYAEHTCYTHVRRDDGANISSRAVDWPGYFGNLAEAVELVERHTEPGALRDRIFRRWLQTEMVARLSGSRFLALNGAEAQSLVASAHQVARTHFSTGVVELLAPGLRPVARALLDGDEAAIRRQAEAVIRWRTRVELLDLHAYGGVLRLSGLGQQYEEQGEPATDGPPETRFLRLVQLPDATPLRAGLGRRSLALTLTERTTGEQWTVPVTLHGTGLLVAFTADVDVGTLAAGRPLPAGVWDLHTHFRVLGVGSRVRPELVRERTLPPGTPLAPGSSLLVRPVLQHRAVSIEVGVRSTGPTTWPGRLPHALRWRWRRLRREISRRATR